MSCMPAYARLTELKTRIDCLKREAESVVSNLRSCVSKGNSIVAFQESIQDVESFLKIYPTAGAELDLLINSIVKLNCELEIILAGKSEISDAASGYESNDATLQAFSLCSACSKEKKTVGVCTEVQSVNTVLAHHVDDISNLYDLEKECILEMRHLLGENPLEFWLGFYSNQKLQSHLAEVKQKIHSGALHRLTRPPQTRQFIIGLTDSIFRGCVLCVYNENIVAIDIDTGTLRFVNVQNSWEIGDCLLHFPPQALLCKLSSVTADVEWCKSLCNIFRNCISKCDLVVTVKDIIPGVLPIYVVDVDAHDKIGLDFNINQWINEYVIPAVENVKICELTDDAVENLLKKIDPYVIYKEESTDSNSEHFSESESNDEIEEDVRENKSNSVIVDEIFDVGASEINLEESQSNDKLEEDIRENHSNSQIVNDSFNVASAKINLEESPSKDVGELVSSTTSENMKSILVNNMCVNNFNNDGKLQESWKKTRCNSSSPENFREPVRPVQFYRARTETESQHPEPVIKSGHIKCFLEKGTTLEMSFLKGSDPWNFILHYFPKEEYDQLKKDMRDNIQNGSIKPLQNIPQIGDFVIGESHHQYCRFCVTDVSKNNEIVAVDVDSGEIKLLSLNYLWELDDAFSVLPAMMVNCSLWNITRTPFYWNLDLKKLFTKVLSKGPLKVLIKDVEPVKGNWKHLVQIKTMHNCVFDISEWIMLYVFPNVDEIQLPISGKTISDIISKIDPDELYNERSDTYVTAPQHENDSKTAIREQTNEEIVVNNDTPSTSKLQSNSGISVLNNGGILQNYKNCFERAYENYKNKELYSALSNKVEKYFIDFKKLTLDVTASTKYFAFLSGILSPSEFYVHIVTAGNSLIDEMHKELQNYCSVGSINFQSKNEAKQLIVNCCAVYYENQWCRGNVIDWLDDCADDVYIFVVDYGIYTSVPFYLVQCLRSDFYKYPPFAQRCSLAYVVPPDEETTWPTRSLEGFWKILDFDAVYEICVESYLESINTLSVFLSYGEGKDIFCINDYLIDKNFAVQKSNLIVNKPEYCHSIVCPIIDIAENLSDEDSSDGQNMSSTLEMMPYFDNNTAGLPEVGDQLPVVITEIVNIGSFYGVLAENYYGGKYRKTSDILMEINKKITSAAESRQLKSSKTLSIGSVVVARFTKDKTWYRGRILTHVDDSGYVDIFFVDYGNTDKVFKEHIKEIRKDFCIFPFQAMRFFIEGVDVTELRNEYAQKKGLNVLAELSAKGVIEVKVVRVINEDVTVHIFSDGVDIAKKILNWHQE